MAKGVQRRIVLGPNLTVQIPGQDFAVEADMDDESQARMDETAGLLDRMQLARKRPAGEWSCGLGVPVKYCNQLNISGLQCSS